MFVRDSRPTSGTAGTVERLLEETVPDTVKYDRALFQIQDIVEELAAESAPASWAREYGGDLLRCIDALRRANAALIDDRDALQAENKVLRNEARRCA
jgi:hypothetical protein